MHLVDTLLNDSTVSKKTDDITNSRVDRGSPTLPSGREFNVSGDRMSIQAISGLSTTQLQSSLLSNSRNTNQQSLSTGDSNPTVGSADLSPAAQFYSKLASLAKTNPDQFKQTTSDIAAALKDAASKTSGPEADFLNNMASRFQTASQTGDPSALAQSSGSQAQAQAVHHHGHHGHHGHARYTESDSSTLQDVLNGIASPTAAGSSPDPTSMLPSAT